MKRLIKSFIGYRNENIYNSGITDPIKIALFELIELGNIDIADYILDNGNLSIEEQKILENIIDNTDDLSEKEINDYKVILKNYLGNRNYAKWVCTSPENVIKFYGDGEITEIEIPDNYIILSDLGDEGLLVAY